MSTAQVDVIECDLSSLHSVAAAADVFLSREWPLHCLILNAGQYDTAEASVTQNGHTLNRIMAVNHLTHYYLSVLLMDRMEATAAEQPNDPIGVRVVYLTSESHRTPRWPSALARLNEQLLF